MSNEERWEDITSIRDEYDVLPADFDKEVESGRLTFADEDTRICLGNLVDISSFSEEFLNKYNVIQVFDKRNEADGSEGPVSVEFELLPLEDEGSGGVYPGTPPSEDVKDSAVAEILKGETGEVVLSRKSQEETVKLLAGALSEAIGRDRDEMIKALGTADLNASISALIAQIASDKEKGEEGLDKAFEKLGDEIGDLKSQVENQPKSRGGGIYAAIGALGLVVGIGFFLWSKNQIQLHEKDAVLKFQQKEQRLVEGLNSQLDAMKYEYQSKELKLKEREAKVDGHLEVLKEGRVKLDKAKEDIWLKSEALNDREKAIKEREKDFEKKMKIFEE